MAPVVARDHGGVGVIGPRWVEDALDPRVAREERGDGGGGRAAPRVQALGLAQARGDGGGARVVEDAAAHRELIHELVAELGVVGGDVAAEREVPAAERLGQAADHDGGALREDGPVERPRGGDRRVDDEPRARGAGVLLCGLSGETGAVPLVAALDVGLDHVVSR